jgi:DNA-binding MarR family transcriptional regulator
MSNDKQTLAHDLANILNLVKRRGFNHHKNNDLMRPSEIMLLSNLANMTEKTGKGVKISEYSNQMQITPAAVTHIIDLLVEKGYVERSSDPDDRRIVLIRPTEAGLQVIVNIENKILKKCGELVEHLGQKDSRELIRLLSTAFDFFDKCKENQGNNLC